MIGPFAAAIASAHRLGIVLDERGTMVYQNGEHADMAKDPPTVVASFVKKAVTTWRLDRIIEAISSLSDARPDIALGGGGSTHLVDFI